MKKEKDKERISPMSTLMDWKENRVPRKSVTTFLHTQTYVHTIA